MNDARDGSLSLGARAALAGAALVSLAWAASTWVWVEQARDRLTERPALEAERLAGRVGAALRAPSVSPRHELRAAVRAAEAAAAADARALAALSPRQRERLERRGRDGPAEVFASALERELESSELDGAWLRGSRSWFVRGRPTSDGGRVGDALLDGACVASTPGRNRDLARCREVEVARGGDSVLVAGGLQRLPPPEVDGLWAVALAGDDMPWAAAPGWEGLVPTVPAGEDVAVGRALGASGPLRWRAERVPGLPARVVAAVPELERPTWSELASGRAGPLTDAWRTWLARSGAVAGGCVLVACLFGWRLRRILAPLVTAAERVGGDAPLPRGLPLGRGDEIGAVAGRLAELGSSLRATRRALERQLEAAAWRDVARTLSHELKNPLVPLRGTLENLARWRLEEPERFDRHVDSRLETMRIEVERLQRLVAALSELSRLPACAPREVDVVEIARRHVTLRADAAPGAADGVTFELSSEPGVPTARVDPDQLSQVLVNLLDNATDSVASAGGGTVRVRVTREGSEVLVGVEDDGTGAGDLPLERLFLPGFTTKAGRGGRGLGLFVCRRMLAEQGAALFAERRPEGRGLRLTMRLPVA